MEADVRYRALSPDQVIQHMYMVHNNHIRAYAAMMTPNGAAALEPGSSKTLSPAEITIQPKLTADD